MITKIEFENYRIFKKRQTLEIRPITIIFGKNNSGKSAVLKLPELALSILHSEDINHFNLNNEKNCGRVRLANEYRDLIYARGAKAASFDFFGENDTKLSFSFHVDLGKLVIDTYEPVKKNGAGTDSTRVDYIEAFRSTPERDIRIETTIPTTAGLDGSNMIQHLLRSVNDTNTNPLYENVSNWYKKNFEGWGIQVDNSNEIYHVGMSYGGLMFTPICDCGIGIAQSLPIVIRSYVECEKPTLIVLEEPESHLNPSAHANMSQLIVESAQKDANKRYLIETHSHTFILRLQRMLAEGTLKPEEVGLYYIYFDETEKNSILTSIEMTRDGRIPNWPKGIFEDVLSEILAINKTRE